MAEKEDKLGPGNHGIKFKQDNTLKKDLSKKKNNIYDIQPMLYSTSLYLYLSPSFFIL